MGCTCSKNLSSRDIREKYKIGPVLGAGSFGQVRMCTKKGTTEMYAVKIMSKDPPKEKRGNNNVDFALMFRNEIALLGMLKHHNIIHFYEFFEDKHFLYAVMEKCEGGELFGHIVKKRRFSEDDASVLCFQMLKAIRYVHSCGIVHRDIKAENFLFSEKSDRGRLVLIDFGMSTKINDDRSLKQLCGSPHYVAPELIRRSYRFKVDMWALGVVIFLMLFGKYPFEGPDQKAIVQAILNADPDYTRNAVPPSSVAIDFMNSLLQKDPEKRLSPDEALNHPWIAERAAKHLSSFGISAETIKEASRKASSRDLTPQHTQELKLYERKLTELDEIHDAKSRGSSSSRRVRQQDVGHTSPPGSGIFEPSEPRSKSSRKVHKYDIRQPAAHQAPTSSSRPRRYVIPTTSVASTSAGKSNGDASPASDNPLQHHQTGGGGEDYKYVKEGEEYASSDLDIDEYDEQGGGDDDGYDAGENAGEDDEANQYVYQSMAVYT